MVLEYFKNEAKEFVCQHCQFTAQNQSTMHYHLLKHQGALPHPCKICDARFLQKSLLDMHIKTRHSETLDKKTTFKCPHESCTFECIQKGNVITHFTRMHLKDLTESLKCKPNEDECVVGCKSCQQSFKSLTRFYYHASKCVNPPSSHPLYGLWNQLNVHQTRSKKVVMG
jgi:hypothetical protein